MLTAQHGASRVLQRGKKLTRLTSQLLLVRSFKILSSLAVFFTSEVKMEREIDRRIGAASAVMRALNRAVVVKRELSHGAKLLIDRSIYVPTLTYGHELWPRGQLRWFGHLCVAEMDHSVQPACPENIFEGPPAEMINSALGSNDDLSFDWHGFKDFLLNDENFDTILNALQKAADPQSAVKQQQYFYYPNNWVPEASFGGQYAAPPFTYLHQPANGVPEPSIVGQYTALPVTYFNHTAPIPTDGVSPAAPIRSTASAAQETVNKSRKIIASSAAPQVYIKKPPNAFMLFLKEQRPLVRPELKTSGSKAVLTYLGAVWKSMPTEQKDKYYKEAEMKKNLHKEQNPGWSTKDNYGRKLTKAGKRRLIKNSGT